MKNLRLVILGMMGRCPFAGQTWLYLNWVRAFSRLGCEVYYVEDDTVWPYDPEEDTVSDRCNYAVKHIARCMDQIGLPGHWAFRLADRKEACWGMTPRQLDDLYRSCDALLNIVGATDLREEQMRAPYRIYVECDPVTAELRLAAGDAHTEWAFRNHHLIFTYGENYGAPDCRVPLNGLEAKYRKTRQPIDLNLWPMIYEPSARCFTTVGNYRQEGSDVEFQGETYRWSKHHEWEKFVDLPRRTTQPFEVALNIAPADRARLEARGWNVVSPLRMSLDIFGAYPEYIRRSRGEWTVAKDQNVRLRSGWFSERDVCYLASGKPVIAQDTGFRNVLPTGEGLFAFRDMAEILESIEAINKDYAHHCRMARRIAEEFFSAPRVGAQLLKEADLSWSTQHGMIGVL